MKRTFTLSKNIMPWPRGRVLTCSQIAHLVDDVLRRFPAPLLEHRAWGYPASPCGYPWSDGRLTFHIALPPALFDLYVDDLHRIASDLEKRSTIRRCEVEPCEVLAVGGLVDRYGELTGDRFGLRYVLVFQPTIRVYDDAGRYLLT